MTKTVIYGALGRHNLGDLLFGRILEALLKDHVTGELVFCDVLTRDMTAFGGHKITSIAKLLEEEEAVNVIHAGGQTGGTPLVGALKMIGATDEDAEDISTLTNAGMHLAYILPKSLFKHPGTFIANGIGGYTQQSVEILKDFDYIGFRDEPSVKAATEDGLQNAVCIPDCAVMTKTLFEDVIEERSNSEAIKRLIASVGKDYIAVQIASSFVEEQSQTLTSQLLEIIEHTNLPLVFFCAGIANYHDTLNSYKKMCGERFPKDKVYFFDDFNIWSICNVIANAMLTIGTSLHVRILSCAYAIPRVTLSMGRPKHQCFVEKWDIQKKSYISPEQLSDTVITLLHTNHPLDVHQKHSKELEKVYMEDGFKRWATALY